MNCKGLDAEGKVNFIRKRNGKAKPQTTRNNAETHINGASYM
jgi:hypothetical protein